MATVALIRGCICKILNKKIEGTACNLCTPIAKAGVSEGEQKGPNQYKRKRNFLKKLCVEPKMNKKYPRGGNFQ